MSCFGDAMVPTVCVPIACANEPTPSTPMDSFPLTVSVGETPLRLYVPLELDPTPSASVPLRVIDPADWLKVAEVVPLPTVKFGAIDEGPMPLTVALPPLR